MIRSQLELEGYEVNLLDELSTQVAPHFSFATGGTRVQVLEEDLQSAIEFLTGLGYLSEKEERKAKWVDKLIVFTGKIPGLRRLRFEARLLIFATIVFSAIIAPLAILSIPSDTEKINNTSWCVVEVKHNGEIIMPEEQIITLTGNGGSEGVRFREERPMILPAYGDNSTNASWLISDGQIVISRISSRSFMGGKENLFLGRFDYSFSEGEMLLTSKETRIVLIRNEIRL